MKPNSVTSSDEIKLAGPEDAKAITQILANLADAIGDGAVFTSTPEIIGRYARIVGDWVTSIGLEASAYGTRLMRRTKVTEIYKKTGHLRAGQLLFARYRGAASDACTACRLRRMPGLVKHGRCISGRRPAQNSNPFRNGPLSGHHKGLFWVGDICVLSGSNRVSKTTGTNGRMRTNQRRNHQA